MDRQINMKIVLHFEFSFKIICKVDFQSFWVRARLLAGGNRYTSIDRPIMFICEVINREME